MSALSRIGFIGPGQMGQPMIERIVSVGAAVTSWSSRAETRSALAAQGVDLAGSPVEVAASASAVVICVFSESQLRQLLIDGGAFDAMLPGTVVINHVTVSVRGVRELATAAADRGLEFVDAPVSGTDVSIREGTLTVLLGGTATAVARARAIVSAYAAPVIETGAVGTASELKLLNNALFAAHAQLAETALRIAEASGIDRAALVSTISRCSGTSGAFAYLRRHGVGTMEGTVRYLVKDVAALRRDIADRGLDLGTLDRVINDGPLPLS